MMLRRRMMGQNESGGLPYDARVEYLGSTGVQYIDTLLYGNKETAMEVDFMPTEMRNSIQYSVAGSRIAGQNTTSLSIFTGVAAITNRFDSMSTSLIMPNARCVAYIDKICFKVDGVTKATWAQEPTEFTTPQTIYFFAIGTFAKLVGRVYSFKLWQSGVLVRDFVPVRVGQVGYMYDRISGKLFGNSGTGDFLIGEDVEDGYDEYVTFKAQSDSSFTLTIPQNLSTSSLSSVSYSIDGGETWVTTPNVNSEEVVITTPTILSGKEVLWKGTGTAYSTSSVNSNFTSTGYFKVYGNILSLTKGDDFVDGGTAGDYSFRRLFLNNTNVTSAEGLVIIPTVVARSSFEELFKGCSALTHACRIKTSARMSASAFSAMFANCTSLVDVPDIEVGLGAGSANNFNQLFYYAFSGCVSLKKAPKISISMTGYMLCAYMFNNCTALVDVPDIDSIPLGGGNVCSYMFSGCTSLKKAPELPITSLGSTCYSGMFNNCTSLTIPPRLPATTLASSCYTQMFYGCSSLENAPELPALTLASSCYSMMFRNCKKLIYVKMLATDISASNCLNNWLMSVGSNGTLVKNSQLEATIPGVPGTWTIINDTDE